MLPTPNKIIINLAPTGITPTKNSNAHVPITPDEIATDVLGCCEHGITLVHIHARDNDGAPTHSKDVYAKIIARLKERRPDLVICVSCSGRISHEFEQRSQALELDGDLRPDMASLTLGSMNFSRVASINTPAMIHDLALKMRDCGIKPELEVFDVGMVNYARYLIDHGVLVPPFYFNVMLGNVATAQADLLQVASILTHLPEQSIWSLAGFGAAQQTMNTLATALGGGVRVGLEDNLWLDTQRAIMASNSALVQRVVQIAALHEREVMAPKEFREAMKLSPA